MMGYSGIEDPNATNITAMQQSMQESSINTGPNNFSALLNMTAVQNGQPFIEGSMSFENASDEMLRRWKQIIESDLPAIDLIDLAAEHNYF